MVSARRHRRQALSTTSSSIWATNSSNTCNTRSTPNRMVVGETHALQTNTWQAAATSSSQHQASTKVTISVCIPHHQIPAYFCKACCYPNNKRKAPRCSSFLISYLTHYTPAAAQTAAWKAWFFFCFSLPNPKNVQTFLCALLSRPKAFAGPSRKVTLFCFLLFGQHSASSGLMGHWERGGGKMYEYYSLAILKGRESVERVWVVS